MSLTENTLPRPTAQLTTAGVDWAKDDYAVCVVDTDGEVVTRARLAYTRTDLASLVALLNQHGVEAVGIERPDGPVVDALLAAGHTIYVISPSQVKALRRRYRSAGNKDDRFDAYVLADTVRTDRRRLTPLLLDTDATTALRKLCRARKDLVAHRIAVANQLRAHLATALPAAVDLFAKIDPAISRAFLTRFTTQDTLDWLSPKRLATWLSRVGYSARTNPATLYQHISAAPRGATGQFGQTLAGITRAYLAALDAITTQIDALVEQITHAMDTHPDKQIWVGNRPRASPISASSRAAPMLNHQHPLPTRPAPSPPTAHPARSTSRGLTQGNSQPHLPRCTRYYTEYNTGYCQDPSRMGGNALDFKPR